MPELVVILVVALVVLGPKRHPEVAKQLGKAMAEFRRQTSDVMEELQSQVMAEDDTDRRRAKEPRPETPEKPPSGQA